MVAGERFHIFPVMMESASASRETPALCGRDALFAALILGTAYTTAGRAPGRPHRIATPSAAQFITFLNIC